MQLAQRTPMIRRASIISVLLITVCQVFSQRTDTRTQIFNPNFRTLITRSSSGLLAQPVVRYGGDERIIVTFDEIADDSRYLQYKLIHCNSDWQPSQLLDSEIVD